MSIFRFCMHVFGLRSTTLSSSLTLIAGLLFSTMALAQTARVTVAPYAIVNGSIADTRVDVTVGNVELTGLQYGEASQAVAAAAESATITAAITGNAQSFVEISGELLAGQQYLLVLSGDGLREPFKAELLADDALPTDPDAAQVRFVHAGFAVANASSLSVRWDLDRVPEVALLTQQFGEVSERTSLPYTDASLRQSNLEVRLAATSQSLVDLRASNFLTGQGILILAGDVADGGLTVDLIGSAAQGRRTLDALMLGPVEVRLVHGATFMDSSNGPADALLSVDAGSNLRIAYAAASSPILLMTQGSHQFTASSTASANSTSATLELDGNRSYLVVAKSYSGDLAAAGSVDPQPFVVIQRDAFNSANLALLSLHYVPSLPSPDQRNAVAVRSDVGEVQAELTATDALRSYSLRSGSTIATNLKFSTRDGKRNLLDLAPVSVAIGSAVDGIVVGNGTSYPFSLVSTSASLAQESLVDRAVSGLWATVERANQGFSLNTLPEEDRLVGSWFTYTEEGGNQRWFIVDSCNSAAGVVACATPASFDNQHAILTVYETSGGSFGGAVPVLGVAGTMEIDFSGCQLAEVSYDLLDFGTGDFQIANLTPSEDCLGIP